MIYDTIRNTVHIGRLFAPKRVKNRGRESSSPIGIFILLIYLLGPLLFVYAPVLYELK